MTFNRKGLPSEGFYDDMSLIRLDYEAEEIAESIRLAKDAEARLSVPPLTVSKKGGKKKQGKEADRLPQARELLRHLFAWKKAVEDATSKEEKEWGSHCRTCGQNFEESPLLFCDDCLCGGCGGNKKFCRGC